MKKKGFTLIEILAVIVILCIIAAIGAINIMKAKNNSYEELLDTTIRNIETTAIIYGQENQEKLISCTVNDVKYDYCLIVTVETLINENYFKTTETNSTGAVDLINHVTNESMLQDKIQIYRKNNRIYANYITEDDTVKIGYANINEACPSGTELSNCVKKLDEDNNTNETGVVKVTESDDEFVDDSIRYSGANPNNFICFGSDAKTCPHANLYRIIGIFKKSNHGVDEELLKLVKYDYEYRSGGAGTKGAWYHYIEPDSTYYKGAYSGFIGGYWYNSSQVNNWRTSSLNTANLNTSFLNSLGTWANYIVSVNWKIGGLSSSDLTSTKLIETYKKEVINSSAYVNTKIGLVYVTDYAYAADKSVWNSSLSNYNSYTSLNWMYMGIHEWTITKSTEYTNKAFSINTDGNVFDRIFPNYCAIRPSFYISSSVKYKSGIGSKSDPIRIER